MLAVSPGFIGDVAIDANNIFWFERDADTLDIMKMPKDQSSPPATFAAVQSPSSGTSGRRLVTHGSYIYWADAGAIVRAPADSGVPETLVTGQEDPGGIAVDDGAVYWANAQSLFAPPGVENNVMAVSLDGGIPVQIGSGFHAGNVVVVGNTVFWSVTTAPGRIMKASRFGGPSSVFFVPRLRQPRRHSSRVPGNRRLDYRWASSVLDLFDKLS